jgi:hypothetical protein
MAQKKNVGYSNEDFKNWYGKYYDENMVDLAPQVQDALESIPFPIGALSRFIEAKFLKEEGYTDLETGYTNELDGSIHAAIFTAMPGVTPEMCDWWFGWHGSQNSRYKLWHPKSHVSSVWEDGEDDITYIGRNSIIEEYIDDKFMKLLIQFKHPTEFGFSINAIKDPSKSVYICATIGHSKFPIDYGYLVHQVRAVEGGSEMRSRFWIGGQYIHARKECKLTGLTSSFIQIMKIISPDLGRKMLIHCSEEMNHLAAFLPTLYAEMKLMGSLVNKTNQCKRPIKCIEDMSVQARKAEQERKIKAAAQRSQSNKNSSTSNY